MSLRGGGVKLQAQYEDIGPQPVTGYQSIVYLISKVNGPTKVTPSDYGYDSRLGLTIYKDEAICDQFDGDSVDWGFSATRDLKLLAMYYMEPRRDDVEWTGYSVARWIPEYEEGHMDEGCSCHVSSGGRYGSCNGIKSKQGKDVLIFIEIS